MKAGVKLAMLGCSGDPKSYYVSDIPGTSSFPKHELVSSLSFLSDLNFCKSEKLLHVKNAFSSSLLCTSLAASKIIPCSLHSFSPAAKNIQLKLTVLWSISRMKTYRKLSIEITLEIFKYVNTLVLDLIILKRSFDNTVIQTLLLPANMHLPQPPKKQRDNSDRRASKQVDLPYKYVQTYRTI